MFFSVFVGVCVCLFVSSTRLFIQTPLARCKCTWALAFKSYTRWRVSSQPSRHYWGNITDVYCSKPLLLTRVPVKLFLMFFFSFSCHKQSQRRRKTSFALNIIFTSQVTFSALWISHVDCTVFRFNLSHMPQEDNNIVTKGIRYQILGPILITSLINLKKNV